MIRIALFFSGSGETALNLVQACREGRVSAEPVLAVSSRAGAPGNSRLEAAGLSVVIVPHSRDPLLVAESVGAHLVCLCGWLPKLLVPSDWEGRILNIHPSLLPAFGGKGFYGLRVHRAVLAAGVAESGCTVHVVDGQYDHGPILAQGRVPVLLEDDPASLRARVFARELELYPEALGAYLEHLELT